jgi:hypothetical protein
VVVTQEQATEMLRLLAGIKDALEWGVIFMSVCGSGIWMAALRRKG